MRTSPIQILTYQIYAHTSWKKNLIPGEGTKQSQGNGILFALRDG